VALPSAAFRYSPPFLLALEQAIWTELIQCLLLSRRIARVRHGGTAPPAPDANSAGEEPVLPEQLLALLPPPPQGGWPKGMPDAPSSAEWLRRWGYPPVRRAQRLSFLIAAGLPSLLGTSMRSLPAPPSALDRQTLLQKTSVRERLQACVVYLCHCRQRLAAMATLDATDLSGFDA